MEYWLESIPLVSNQSPTKNEIIIITRLIREESGISTTEQKNVNTFPIQISLNDASISRLFTHVKISVISQSPNIRTEEDLTTPVMKAQGESTTERQTLHV